MTPIYLYIYIYIHTHTHARTHATAAMSKVFDRFHVSRGFSLHHRVYDKARADHVVVAASFSIYFLASNTVITWLEIVV